MGSNKQRPDYTIDRYLETPDLTNEFHPMPKTFKAKKESKPLGAGKKTKEWGSAREDLKKIFAENGITQCELNYDDCWINNALSFAHAKKRRHLTKDDLKLVVLACQPCHAIIEELPESEMEKVVMNIIERRDLHE